MQNQTQLLKTKRFLPLFITQFFGAFNDNAFKNAFLIWFTYDVAVHSGLNASMMVTLAAGLFMLPFFLFSATAGQLADKYEKSWLTQKIKQVEIVLMLACVLCFFMESVYGLLVVLFLMGAQSTFFGPIKYSLLPEHLHEDELISGNGLIESGTFLSILLGTIFGGLIIRMEYGMEILSFCIIAFAVIGFAASLYIPKTPIADPKLKIGWNIAKETLTIIGYAKEERSVWLSILAISWFWLIGTTFLTQFPVYTKDVIGGNEHVVTLFLTIFSFGIGIGSVLCNKLLKGKIDGRLVPHGAFGMSIAIFAFVIFSYLYEAERITYFNQIGLIPLDENSILTFLEFFAVGLSSFGIIISLLLLSIFSGIYIVPLYAIMQHRSHANHVSRVIAANNVINALFMVGASVIALILFSLGFTVTNILLTVGLANIPVFLVVRRVVKRRLNNA